VQADRDTEGVVKKASMEEGNLKEEKKGEEHKEEEKCEERNVKENKLKEEKEGGRETKILLRLSVTHTNTHTCTRSPWMYACLRN
jgi:hypothetical protein